MQFTFRKTYLFLSYDFMKLFVIFFLFTLSFRMFHHEELEISLSVFPFASVFVSDNNFSSKRIKSELFLSQ